MMCVPHLRNAREITTMFMSCAREMRRVPHLKMLAKLGDVQHWPKTSGAYFFIKVPNSSYFRNISVNSFGSVVGSSQTKPRHT